MRKFKLNKTFWIYLAAFLIFTIGALFITFPLILNMGSIATGYGDELVISWILAWGTHAIFTNPFALFNANIYFPYSNTLAYSDIHLVSSMIAYPALVILKEPIVAFNFTVISSLILVPFGVFVLSFYLTNNFWAALVSGLLVLFSPVFLDKKVHVQVLALEWIPFSIFYFLNYVKKKKIFYFTLAMFFFLLQTYNSFMPGYFLVFFYLIYLIYYWFYKKKELLKIINLKVLLITFVSLVLIIPIALPYFKVSNEFSYKRDIRDTIHFALQPEDLLRPNEHTRLSTELLWIFSSVHYSPNAELKPGYIGFVFSIIFLWCLFHFVKYFRKNTPLFNIFMIAALFGLITSFGPFLHINRLTIHKPFPIPLPYAVFYYVVPGFAGFRNSSNFEMMFVVFASIAAAIFISEFLKKRSENYKRILFAVLIIGIVLEFNFPMRFFPVTQIKNSPPIYSWIDKNISNRDALIFLPAYNWNMTGSGKEFWREYFLATTFPKMVNGYTGFSPPPWQNLLIDLSRNFPSKKTISAIKKTGVKYVILDLKSYDEDYKNKLIPVNSATVTKKLLNDSMLVPVNRIGDYYVFKFK